VVALGRILAYVLFIYVYQLHVQTSHCVDYLSLDLCDRLLFNCVRCDSEYRKSMQHTVSSLSTAQKNVSAWETQHVGVIHSLDEPLALAKLGWLRLALQTLCNLCSHRNNSCKLLTHAVPHCGKAHWLRALLITV
jgi:hypothetical protein